MASIRVVVNGATGKMGMETVAAIGREDDLKLSGATCLRERGNSMPISGGGEVPLSTNLEDLLAQTQEAAERSVFEKRLRLLRARLGESGRGASRLLELGRYHDRLREKWEGD